MTEAERLAQALTNPRRWHELTDDECDAAAAELRRLSADAQRYAWLRNKADGESHIDHTMDQSGGGTYLELWVPFQPADPFDIDFGAELDAAIDQAMKDTP